MWKDGHCQREFSDGNGVCARWPAAVCTCSCRIRLVETTVFSVFESRTENDRDANNAFLPACDHEPAHCRVGTRKPADHECRSSLRADSPQWPETIEQSMNANGSAPVAESNIYHDLIAAAKRSSPSIEHIMHEKYA